MYRIRRLTPLTGLAGIGLLIAGLATDTAPTSSWPDAHIEHWYAHHSLGHWLLSAYLLAAAAPFLLAFTAEARARIAEYGAGGRSQALVLGSGVAFAVTVLTGAGLYAAIPAAMTFSSAPAPGADISRYLLGAAYGTLVMFSAFAAALLAATLSIASLRHHALHRWVAVTGIPASLLMLANAALPMGVITLWFAAASVSLTVRRTATAHTHVPNPAAAVTASA